MKYLVINNISIDKNIKYIFFKNMMVRKRRCDCWGNLNYFVFFGCFNYCLKL